ncbi:MAG: phosphate acyltransferase PlsX [Holosporales bacterium]|nr:phosphate acyltransferase PlsX [Holosporales bacterium]
MIKVALDAMGGDLGITASIHGLDYYLSKSANLKVFFNIFGNKKQIEDSISKCKNISSDIYEIFETGDKKINSNDKPSVAIRKGKGSSMFDAISHVANEKSNVVVSSGNTGAYMALSKMLLGTIEEIERPALVCVMPNIKGKSVMLDLGANVDCSSSKLIQFALMGQAVARVLLKINNPSVGLLNIGTERSKGTNALEEAFDFLSGSDINFIGFIEGVDITKGTADVIVTDGFSGNISLKTMEGTIRYLTSLAQAELKSSILGKIGYLFGRNIVKSIKNAIDPRNHNGAPLVGLQKIAVKSHGNSDHIGFSNAISAAVNLAESDFVNNIKEAISIIGIDKSNENNNKKR